MAYYIGKAIKEQHSSLAERSLYWNKFSINYHQNCQKIYELFESLGINQIYQSKRMHFSMFRQIKGNNWTQLLQEASLLLLGD